jgi:DNA-binding CsgD family transcriptional regulator
MEAIGYIDEYAKPTFCEYQLGYYLRAPGRLACITCNRNGREFTDKEKAVVEFLTPHLQAAFENCLAFEANVALVARAAAARRVTSQEMIWLDRALAVVEITPRIRELIREFFNEEMGSRQLPQKITEWLHPAVSSRAHPPLRPLIIRRPNASLKIRLYPEQLPGLHLLTFHRQSITPTLDDLKPFGLSRRESEVLLWLAQGKTNAEISRILYINRRTVDGHVQAILAKLGVENRTAASLLVADLLHG